MSEWQNRILEYGVKTADQFTANPANPRVHPQFQRDVMKAALDTLGWIAPVIENKRTGYLVDGHERVMQALLKNEPVPFVLVDLDESEEAQALATFDPIGDLAAYDASLFDDLLREFNTDSPAIQQLLSDLVDKTQLYEGGSLANVEHVSLSERFIVPPFSVLDARQGYWQERKRSWLALGLQSELGRGGGGVPPPHPPTVTQNPDGTLNYSGTDGQSQRFDRQRQQNAAPGGSLRDAATLVNGKAVRGDGTGKRIKGKLPADSGGQPLPLDRMANGKSPARTFAQDLMRGEHVVGSNGKLKAATYGAVGKSDDVSRKNLAANPHSRYNADLNSNINDAPALPIGATQTGTANMSSGTSIFDPVLCELAYRWFSPPDGKVLDPFAGGSVRGIVAHKLGRQYTGIDLRAEQIEANEQQAIAIVPDNLPRWIVGNSLTAIPDEIFDFIFSCPPYFDLEIYSDDTEDLSNAGDYSAFLADYRRIIAECVKRLENNRFACFVVGDIRDKQGLYRNFVSDTIAAFQDAGAKLYNEAVLVTSVGSLPVRVRKQFESGRKLGKTHQNVLVFIKGNPREAVKACGDVEAFWPESDSPDEIGASGDG